MTDSRIGKVYSIPPQPPVEADTHRVPAGVVTFGVEYRDVDPESLRATYSENASHLAELEEQSPEGGFSDRGVSIHVFDTDDGHEYLRFDVFDDEPHYHYVHKTAPHEDIVNNVIEYDATAQGDMFSWVIERLRTRLSVMLRAAGGELLATRLDPEAIARAIDEVERLATEARAAQSPTR